MTDDGINKKEFIERAKGPIESCEELSEEMIWSRHGTAIWKADRFVGSPYFYPVYNYHDLYSYSVINLIMYKGNIRINDNVVEAASRPDFLYYPGMDTVDKEISRIGGPLVPNFEIKGGDELARRVAVALRADISAAEKAHPGYTNIILCGGKDSLNLLLLPWENPVLVASGPPNYELVKIFIDENGLKHDVIPLEDTNPSLRDEEILANCCQNNLEHCRYGYHLRELSRSFEGKAVFWNGQLGDTFLTTSWKSYSPPKPYFVSEVAKRTAGAFSKILGNWVRDSLLDKTGFTQRYFFRYLWDKGAMWQGAHQSMMRKIADAIVLSAYHGKEMRRVLIEIDLYNSVQHDIRPIVGEQLLGGHVKYPSENPGPPESRIRKGISHAEPFIEVLSSMGITIQ